MEALSYSNKNEFEELFGNNALLLCYYSYEACGVCKVLKPKVLEIISKEYPKTNFVYVDIKKHPELSAQNQVFTVPTILFYVDGREHFRLGRNFGIDELRYKIEKIYNLYYQE